MSKRVLFIRISIAFLIVALAGYIVFSRPEQKDAPTPPTITSFEECQKAGHPIAESYPPQCRVPGGPVFTQDIGNALELQDTIRVTNPQPGEKITNPLTITGQARGTWYFEADFPIRLIDEQGKELGAAIAEAKSDWMTEQFVPFTATLTFTPGKPGKATLILEKSNPSGLPENAAELKIPVQIQTNN
jgi:hypothetical protein